jgi:hypothetical protein
VTEEIVAEVGEDPFARPAGEVRLRRAREQAPGSRHDHQDDERREAGEVLAADAVVDRELGEVGRDQRGQRREQERDDRERRPQPVRLRVAREEADPPDRRLPRPVAHLRASLHRQVPAGLPDFHFKTARNRCEAAKRSRTAQRP